MMLKPLSSDQRYASITLILSLLYLYLGCGVEEGFLSDPVGSAWWIKGLAMVLVGLSLLLFFFPSNFVGQFPVMSEWLNRLPFILIVIAYASFLPIVGFFIATPVLITSLALLFGAKLYPASVSAMLMTIVCYAIFDWLLGISLPSGFL